jgi:hypothetical protein
MNLSKNETTLRPWGGLATPKTQILFFWAFWARPDHSLGWFAYPDRLWGGSTPWPKWGSLATLVWPLASPLILIFIFLMVLVF